MKNRAIAVAALVCAFLVGGAGMATADPSVRLVGNGTGISHVTGYADGDGLPLNPCVGINVNPKGGVVSVHTDTGVHDISYMDIPPDQCPVAP